MADATFDLYLGGDLGAWSLDVIEREAIAQIVTVEDSIAAAAHARGLGVVRPEADAGGPARGTVAFSVHYPRILPGALLDRYDRRFNVHPGLLPWGRGYYPVFWALWERTPAGATLHEMVEGVDEGPIVDQVEVPHGPQDTGGSLHARVREAERELVRRWWRRLLSGAVPTRSQQGAGLVHRRQEFLALRSGDGWRELSAERLVDLARCLTFPGHPGLEVRSGDARFSLEVECLGVTEQPGERASAAESTPGGRPAPGPRR